MPSINGPLVKPDPRDTRSDYPYTTGEERGSSGEEPLHYKEILKDPIHPRKQFNGLHRSGVLDLLPYRRKIL